MKVYQRLAQTIDAFHRCKKEGNPYADKHLEYIGELMKYLPSGSGVDAGNFIEYEKSNAEKLVITSHFHKMDGAGFYDGWIMFKITITPSLMFGFNMSIVGNFGKRQEIKEYLYDIYREALDEECFRPTGQ